MNFVPYRQGFRTLLTRNRKDDGAQSSRTTHQVVCSHVEFYTMISYRLPHLSPPPGPMIAVFPLLYLLFFLTPSFFSGFVSPAAPTNLSPYHSRLNFEGIWILSKKRRITPMNMHRIFYPDIYFIIELYHSVERNIYLDYEIIPESYISWVRWRAEHRGSKAAVQHLQIPDQRFQIILFSTTASKHII